MLLITSRKDLLLDLSFLKNSSNIEKLNFKFIYLSLVFKFKYISLFSITSFFSNIVFSLEGSISSRLSNILKALLFFSKNIILNIILFSI